MVTAGRRDDGVMIKEYEASHGTVADLWEAHLRGEETSFNPLGMVGPSLHHFLITCQLHCVPSLQSIMSL